MQNEFNDAARRDPQLWRIAKKRASFKYHLTSYLLVNGFLWMLWLFTTDNINFDGRMPWPAFTTFGWGIGLFFHFMGAYVNAGNSLAEQEYLKLTREKNI